jgi:hypothetical protein
MPLKKGPGSIRSNVTELMGKVNSPARKKAISTIMKTHNMTRSQAQFQQAKAIAISQSRKK